MHARTAIILPRAVAAILSLALIASACGSDSTDTSVGAGPTAGPDPGTDQVSEPAAPIDKAALEALDAARQRWTSAGLSDYAYTYTRSCECVEEERGPNIVTVDAGAVSGVRGALGDQIDVSAQTVDELFDLTEASIRDGRRTANEYDPELGYPTVVSLDVDAQAVDGGFSLSIVGLTLTGRLRAELAAARALWEASGPSSYVMTFRPICFCVETRATATIDEGVVVGFEADDGGLVDRLTVEDLFDEVQAALDGAAATITVTYDPALGYPTEYFIDEVLLMADEEHGIAVESLVVR